MRPARVLMALTVACVLTPAAGAAASSTVFLRDGDVWLGDREAGTARPLTTAGTPAAPYREPSLSDNGVVAALRGAEVVWTDAAGSPLGATPLPAQVAASVTGLDVSPDGARAAVAHVSAGAPVVRVVPRAAGAPREVRGLSAPRWVTGAAGPVLAGVGADGTAVVVEGPPGVADWVGYPVVRSFDATGDPRGRLVLLGEPEEPDGGVPLDVLSLAGPAPADPDFACSLELPPGASDVAVSRDGTRVLWTTPEGLWVSPTPVTATGCAPAPRLAVPGASAPDTGVAPATPGAGDATGAPEATTADPVVTAVGATPAGPRAAPPALRAAGVGHGRSGRVLVLRLAAPSRVTALVERRAGARWVRVRRIAATAPGGRVVMSLGRLTRGAHRVRVTVRPRTPGTSAVTAVNRFPVR